MPPEMGLDTGCTVLELPAALAPRGTWFKQHPGLPPPAGSASASPRPCEWLPQSDRVRGVKSSPGLPLFVAFGFGCGQVKDLKRALSWACGW